MGSIAIVKASLARRGLAPTMARIRARGRTVDPQPTADSQVVDRVDRLVALAAAFYPGRALCLERSLVLYDRLLRLGIDVTFQLGVQAAPFASHAWIEWRGGPVNDVLEHVEQFAPVPMAGL